MLNKLAKKQTICCGTIMVVICIMIVTKLVTKIKNLCQMILSVNAFNEFIKSFTFPEQEEI